MNSRRAFFTSEDIIELAKEFGSLGLLEKFDVLVCAGDYARAWR